MKRTLGRWISNQWRDHSEQIKQLVALGATDKKVLEQARSYIHSLDLKKIICELDDVIELAFLLPKTEYPPNTQVPVVLQEQTAKFESQISPSHVKNISSFIQLLPESLPSFIDTIFSVDAFLSKFEGTVEQMDLEDMVDFANALSRADGVSLCVSKKKQLSSLISSSLLKGIDRDEASHALQVLLTCEFPVWKCIPTLPQKVECLYKELSKSQILDYILSFNSAQVNHREWGIVFQQLFCRTISKFDFFEVVRVFEKLVTLQIPIREKLWKELAKHTKSSEMSLELLEPLCSSIALSKYSKNAEHKETVSKSLMTQLEMGINSKGSVISEENIRYLLCYGFICEENARRIFSHMDYAKFQASESSVVHLCKLMHRVNVFPRDLVSRLCMISPKRLSHEDYIFLLNAVFYSGLSISENLLQQAVGSYGHRQFSSRKGSRTAPLSPTSVYLLLNVLANLDTTKYSAKLFPIPSLLALLSSGISERLSLLSASVTHNRNPALSKMYLQDALSRARQCDQKQLETLFLALAALRMREAVVYTKLLRIAEEMEPTVGLALSAAKAGRSLKLIQQFSRTTLIEAIKTLSGTSFDTFVELLKYCTKNQREHLVKLPGGKKLLDSANLENVTTSSLLILANTSSVQRKTFIRLLKDRSPMAPGDVTSEEVVLNLEDTKSAQEVELMLRIGGPCMEDLDERQIMRVHRTLSTVNMCPNIAFRIFGRSVMKNIKSLTADEALMWLNLYVKYEVRDDAVAKVLIKKAQSRRVWTSKELESQMQKAENFFGISHQRVTVKKDKNTAYYSTTL